MAEKKVTAKKAPAPAKKEKPELVHCSGCANCLTNVLYGMAYCSAWGRAVTEDPKEGFCHRAVPKE